MHRTTAKFDKPLIKLQGVSKRFRLNPQVDRSFMSVFTRLGRGRDTYVSGQQWFWALRDVSFDVYRGESVGIVGENGSGKSTLLKVISRILEPTNGVVEVNGRIATLLELGAGFHPDLTGRENIYLNGSIVGLSRQEVDECLEDIIEFADIGSFVDIPVKFYSSGMRVRLGFSIAIHVYPDVMLVDEVLAVGDEDFQRKCMKAFYDFLADGGTLVLVSHSVELVREMCHRAIWLDEGQIRADGPVIDVVAQYLRHVHHKERQRLNEQAAAAAQSAPQALETISTMLDSANELVGLNEGGATLAPDVRASSQEDDTAGQAERWGDQRVRIDRVRILDRNRQENKLFYTGDPLTIEFDYIVRQQLDAPPVVGVAFLRQDGLWCYGTNTQIDGISPTHMCAPEHRKGTVVITFPSLTLLPGEYSIDLALQNPYGGDHDYFRHCAHISVRSLINDTGVSRIDHEWDFLYS